MDESETYVNMRLTRTDAQARSRAEPDVSYVELNVTALSAPRDRGDGGGLSSSYAAVNFPNDEPVIDEDESPPIAAGPRKLPTNGQAAAHEQESNVKIGNRPYSLICLLCLVTSAFIVIVAGLSIDVSQIRQSKITSDRNYHELNSTVQSKLSALNSNLSDLKRMHSDLRHQFTEMETKYRSVNETKAQICELLTSRREQTCSQDWISNEDQFYFISSFESSYERAKQLCSIADSKLLEINSNEEENFVNNRVRGQDSSYWIGTCKAGKVASNIVYEVKSGKFECSECESRWHGSCKYDQHRFICEKPAPLCPDIPEKIRDLCQKPVEPT